MDLASLLAGVLGPAFQVTGLALINGLESAVQIAAPIIENVIGIFTGLLNFITGVFTGNWELAWQGVCDIFGNLFGGLANIAKVPINAVIGAVNSVIGAINSCGFTIPDWVPVVGGMVRTPPKVTVLVVWFQSTFLPISSPMARTGR